MAALPRPRRDAPAETLVRLREALAPGDHLLCLDLVTGRSGFPTAGSALVYTVDGAGLPRRRGDALTATFRPPRPNEPRVPGFGEFFDAIRARLPDPARTTPLIWAYAYRPDALEARFIGKLVERAPLDLLLVVERARALAPESEVAGLVAAAGGLADRAPLAHPSLRGQSPAGAMAALFERSIIALAPQLGLGRPKALPAPAESAMDAPAPTPAGSRRGGWTPPERTPARDRAVLEHFDAVLDRRRAQLAEYARSIGERDPDGWAEKELWRDPRLAELVEHINGDDCDHDHAEHLTALRIMTMPQSDHQAASEAESGSFLQWMSRLDPSVRGADGSERDPLVDARPDKTSDEHGFDRIMLGSVGLLGIDPTHGFLGVEVKTAVNRDVLRQEIKEVAIGIRGGELEDRDSPETLAEIDAAKARLEKQLNDNRRHMVPGYTPEQFAADKELVRNAYRRGGYARTVDAMRKAIAAHYAAAQTGTEEERTAHLRAAAALDSNLRKLALVRPEQLATALFARSKTTETSMRPSGLARVLFDRIIIVNVYGQAITVEGDGFEPEENARMAARVASERRRFNHEIFAEEVRASLARGETVDPELAAAAGVDPAGVAPAARQRPSAFGRPR